MLGSLALPGSAIPLPSGLDIDGLYRISGNLATIQKLRYKVDHGEVLPQSLLWGLKAQVDADCLPHPTADERLDLDDGRWDDVHVITGALKLFFRELPEPLFPFSHFHQFIAAISEWLRERTGGEVGPPLSQPADSHLWFLPPPRAAGPSPAQPLCT